MTSLTVNNPSGHNDKTEASNEEVAQTFVPEDTFVQPSAEEMEAAIQTAIEHCKNILSMDEGYTYINNGGNFSRMEESIIFSCGRFKRNKKPEIVLLGVDPQAADMILNYIIGYDIDIDEHRTCSIGSMYNAVLDINYTLANLSRKNINWLIPDAPDISDNFIKNVREFTGLDRIYKAVYGDDVDVPIVVLTGPVIPGDIEIFKTTAQSQAEIQMLYGVLAVIMHYDMEIIPAELSQTTETQQDQPEAE